MDKKLFIEGIGWVIEITINRPNECGINEPYTEYRQVNLRNLNRQKPARAHKQTQKNHEKLQLKKKKKIN